MTELAEEQRLAIIADFVRFGFTEADFEHFAHLAEAYTRGEDVADEDDEPDDEEEGDARRETDDEFRARQQQLRDRQGMEQIRLWLASEHLAARTLVAPVLPPRTRRTSTRPPAATAAVPDRDKELRRLQTLATALSPADEHQHGETAYYRDTELQRLVAGVRQRRFVAAELLAFLPNDLVQTYLLTGELRVTLRLNRRRTEYWGIAPDMCYRYMGHEPFTGDKLAYCIVPHTNWHRESDCRDSSVMLARWLHLTFNHTRFMRTALRQA